MKQPKLPALNILIAATVLIIVSACNNSAEIPFPPGETEFPQPVSNAIKFSEPWKITWSDSVTGVKPLVKNFDFNKLPARIFDTSGFLPFAKKPEEVRFNWDNLRDTAFNYDSLPSQPLKFEISVLEPPKLIKAGHPFIKTGSSELVYELGEQQGLISGNIYFVFEDKSGFLWIATDQGVYRYDGENLALYIRGPITKPINNMQEDNEGQIWIGTFGNGIMVINLKAGIIKRLTTGLYNNRILQMFADKENRVWVGTLPDNIRDYNTPNPGGGVNIIDLNTNTIKQLSEAQGLSNNVGIGIFEDGQNTWIATLQGGINILDIKNKKIKYLNKENGLNSDTLITLHPDNANRILAATFFGEINVIDVKQGMINHFNKEQGLVNNFINNLFNDATGNIWASVGNNGVIIINPAKEKFKTIKTVNGLNSDNVQWIMQDRLGQVWIATNAGLNMLNKSGNNIEHSGKKEILTLAEDAHEQVWIGTYKGIDILDTATGLTRSLTTANGLGNDTVQNMIVENGNTWVGTNRGIDIVDSARKTIRHIGKAQGLKADAEPIMMKDKQGRMWCGAVSNDAAGIDVLDLRKGTIQHLGIAQGLKDTIISDIKQDRQGFIWITNLTGGVYVFDPEKNMMKYLGDTSALRERYNKLLLPDEKGNMWIGTNKGIYIINAKGDSLTTFSTHEGLLNDNIISLHEYNGRIYAGTKAGVSVITPPSSLQENWQVESFGKWQGINKLNNSYASDIITKKGLFLWGDMGITVLSCLNEDTIHPNTYVTALDIFNQTQYFAAKTWSAVSESDTLWSSKKDTFYVRGQLPVNKLFPQQDKMKWDSVTETYNLPVNLHLPYYENYFQFHFAQAHLGSQDTIWYSYILQGIDKKWSDRTYNTYSQNYLNLPPGEYQFKVSGMYKGKWSEPDIFKFTITPPWWQSWWAYVLYIIIFIGLVWAFAQYRSRKLKRENMLLEEKITRRTMQLQRSIEELKSTQTLLIQSEKMASLGELTAGIAHEIQNPLNFVNNFSEVNAELIDEMQQALQTGNTDEAFSISNDIKENEQKIIHHGKRADSIVKGMLLHSRTSTGKKELTDINALADEYLRLSYHGLRAKDKSFNAMMNTDFDEHIGQINVIQQDIGRVLLNLINNAFYAVTEKKKQSDKNYEPTVSVSTKKVDDKILISVKDNGNGIPQKIVDKIFQPFFTTKPTGQGTGLGLSLSYDIIKAHGGEIKVNTKEGEGSEFIIQLPVV